MKLADIIKMQVDRRNGVMLSPITIDKLILHALAREVQADKDHAQIERLETELRAAEALLDLNHGRS